MKVALRYVPVILIPLLWCYCTQSSKDFNTSNAYSDPEVTLSAFFDACGSIDSSKIASLSMVEEYPMLNSWNLRRVGEPRLWTQISTLNDSVASIDDQIALVDMARQKLQDSLLLYNKAYERYVRDWQAFYKAEVEWEKNVGKSELKRIADLYHERCLNSYRTYDAKFARSVDGKKLFELDEVAVFKFPQSSEHQNLINRNDRLSREVTRMQVLKERIKRIQKSAEKSLGRKPTNDISIYSLMAIVDLQIPSKAGIMLNKKCRVELISTDGAKPYSKWLVMDLSYIGE